MWIRNDDVFSRRVDFPKHRNSLWGISFRNVDLHNSKTPDTARKLNMMLEESFASQVLE